MFNLFRSRQKMTKYLLGGLMLILAASMLTYLTQTGFTTTSDGDPVLAEVGGQPITVVEVQSAINRLIQNQRLPVESADVYLPQYLDDLVQQRAAMYEFQRMGVTVSDEEVLSTIMAIFPQYFTNGKLTNQAGLEQAVAQNNATLQELVDQTREMLALRKIQSIAASTVVVSPAEVDEAISRRHQKAKIEYVAFVPGKFRDQVKPTTEDLKKLFEQSKSAYMIPEKRSFQVLLVDQEKVEQSINVPEQQLRAAYAASMDNYRMPERVKARHILLMTQGKSDAEKKAKLTKAQDLLKQLRAGADFAELAKKNSEDPGSAQNGGDLGYFVRGQMVPEFDKYAFSGKVNEISDIVTTEFGYHIIQILEKEPARVKPFDEVKDALATELKKQSAAEKTQALADQAHAALEKSPGSAAEIAKQLGIEWINVTRASGADPIPGLGSSPEIDAALAGLQPNGVSQPILLPANRMAIVVLTERIPSRPAEFSEVEPQVRDRFVATKSAELALAAAQTAADKVRAGEDLAKVARAAGVNVVRPAEFTINDSVEGLGTASYVANAFTKPVGSVEGPVSVEGINVLYKIVERKPVDVKEFSAEREAIIRELKQQKARTQYQYLLDSVTSRARASGKVKIHQDSLQRLAASYRQGR